MRIGVVDIGTNSTRLLIADVGAEGAVAELDRRTRVTRLGDGVDASGALAEASMARVFATLDAYAAAIAAAGCDATTAVLTSAVRDAANGAQFTATVRDRYGLDARTITGEEEAALTYRGATSERADRPGAGPLLVIDIGGGSTELVVGSGSDVRFHVSTQVGVVRASERHLHHDPPLPAELAALRAEAGATFAAAVPAEARASVAVGIAVAGTATSCASIDLALEPYDPARVHGHRLALATLEALLERLAAMTVEARRAVVGLHPDRAPTIVAGVGILVESLRAFGLEAVEVSEHDILRGAALACAAERRPG